MSTTRLRHLLRPCLVTIAAFGMLATAITPVYAAHANGAMRTHTAIANTGPSGSYLYDDAVNAQRSTRSGCSAGWQVDPNQSNGGAPGVTAYIAPSTGTTDCYDATWSDPAFTQMRGCYVDVWVSVNANANVTYKFIGSNGQSFYTATLNQANTANGWHRFADGNGVAIGFNDLRSITATSATGYTSNRGNVSDHWFGAAGMDFTCQFTPYISNANLASNPNNCSQLGLNGWPTPFSGAKQIPGSVAFTFTSPWSYSIAPCETADTNENNNATEDGYGNPFQCVELIKRYTSIRYGISTNDWNQSGAVDGYTYFGHHPPQFTATQYVAGAVISLPHVGDIMVWDQDPTNSGGHVAIVTAVNGAQKKITVLDENAFTNDGLYHTSSRVFGYYYEVGVGYTIFNSFTYYGGANGQDTGSRNVVYNHPELDTLLGWLHTNL